ncbi:RYamide receptor-like [Limulus polyphemus]|uniref:RYamide receptor-like n=1 Tax=Limulus polyphemus TaxID=6850 RepID=A0ABM1SZE8_LIMPO|nr:RYamide receptor-like [Limulus polyphemus]
MSSTQSHESPSLNDTFLNNSEILLVAFTNSSLPPEASIEIYDVPVAIIILLSFCYGTVSLVAVIGNFCVLWIVATSRRMQTVTNFFIANLACADIIIGLFSIPFQFQAALLQRWVLPNFMCAFCPFVQVLSVNVSIFTLTAIALDRYRAVVFPLKVRTSKFRAKLIIAGIWAFGGATGIPYALALRVSQVYDPTTNNYTKPFCDNIEFSPTAWKTYKHVLVCIQYFVPLFIISFAYSRMGLKLKDGQVPGNSHGPRDRGIIKNKKKVIKMLFIVVTIFAFCWLPFQTYNILQEIVPKINEYKYINVIWFCCHWLAMSNSCCNPFIYAIYNVGPIRRANRRRRPERFRLEFRGRLQQNSHHRRFEQQFLELHNSNPTVLRPRRSFDGSGRKQSVCPF